MYILKLSIFLQLFFLIISNQNINPSPRTGPQDLLVTHYDCEENEQKTLHKYAINQVSQCETEPQAIETTNVIAALYSKARATTVTGYKFTATFSEKKVHCSQVSIEVNIIQDQEITHITDQTAIIKIDREIIHKIDIQVIIIVIEIIPNHHTGIKITIITLIIATEVVHLNIKDKSIKYSLTQKQHQTLQVLRTQ